MPEPEPVPESERFLELVDRHLPFADGERAEILEELRVHLADSTAAMQGAGVDPVEAERAAVERLGSAERLARELARARRDRSRLLAAAGAGAWGVVRGGVWGGLVGLGIALLASVTLTALVNIAVHQLGVWLDSASLAVPPAIAVLGIAVFVAGRVVTPTVAARAAFVGSQVRRVTVPAGALALLAYALLGWSGRLNWPTVIMLVSLPLWWIAGAWQTRPFQLGYPRRLARGLLVAIGVAFVASIVAATDFSWSKTAAPANPNYPELHAWQLDYSRIAPDAQSLLDIPWLAGGIISGSDTQPVMSMILSERGHLAEWRDLRVEAWATSGDPRIVDPKETEPLATGPLQWIAGTRTPDGKDLSAKDPGEVPYPATAVTLGGSVSLPHWTGTNWFLLALTGVDQHGQRQLIWLPQAFSASFDGTALDWFGAVLAGH